jgi:hypothetical protein
MMWDFVKHNDTFTFYYLVFGMYNWTSLFITCMSRIYHKIKQCDEHSIFKIKETFKR